MSLRACLVPGFLKLFLRIVFENIKNTILMFSEFNDCSLNLMFYVFSMFFKKMERDPNILFGSLFSLFFITKTVLKNYNRL